MAHYHEVTNEQIQLEQPIYHFHPSLGPNCDLMFFQLFQYDFKQLKYRGLNQSVGQNSPLDEFLVSLLTMSRVVLSKQWIELKFVL